MSNETDSTNETNDILTDLKKSKKAHDEFAKKFKEKYLIAGRPVGEWKEHFRLNLPPDLDTQTCKEADVQLMELHQEASFLKAEVEARLAAYKGTSDDRYRARYAQLVAEYQDSGQRLPARDTLAALAENAVGNIKNALIHAEIELAFWKEVLSDLRNSRRLVENATLNLNVEARALQNSFYLDKVNTSR